MNGLHRIGDIYRCRGAQDTLTRGSALEALSVGERRRVGLAPLGAHFGPFENADRQAAGNAGTLALVESHRAIHAWSATGDATPDVYVGKLSRDSSFRARQVFSRVMELLAPDEVVAPEIVCGRLPVSA